jgi:hypothetical protein
MGKDCGTREGGSQDPAPPAPASGAKPDQGVGWDKPNADVELGECELGPVEDFGSDDPCAWVAEDRCYKTREMACNCACPRSRDSQCASGFDNGPDGHVWVSCR